MPALPAACATHVVQACITCGLIGLSRASYAGFALPRSISR